MSDIVNIHEAKTHLSRLLERVRRGATITIAKAGTPVALLADEPLLFTGDDFARTDVMAVQY